MAETKAVRFLESLYDRVDKQVREIVSAMLPEISVAAQDDGSVIANQWRILNFQGAGVVVSEDPARRRVNINIPGAPAASTQTAFVSATGAEQVLDNGVSGTGPTNWQLASFNHAGAGWTASLLDTSGVAGMPTVPTGAAYTTKFAGLVIQPTNERFLFWRSFTPPAGTISSVDYIVAADNFIEQLWINGTQVSTNALLDSALQTISISPALLVPGSANGMAMMIRNLAAGGNNVMRIGYRLEVNYVAGGVDAQYQLVSEKNQANGYAGLDAGVRVPTARLGSGTANGTTFLRGDQTWAAASTNAVTVQEVDGAPSVSATIVRFPNGTLTDDGGGQVTYVAATVTGSYINIRDQKTQNTAGGTFTAGAWQKRDLNTIQADPGSNASLSSSQITLLAGTYRASITCPSFGVARNQARLQNITDTTTTLLGTSAFSSGTSNQPQPSLITGRFTIAATKVFEVQHQGAATQGTNGFGVEANLATEIYTVAEFWKE